MQVEAEVRYRLTRRTISFPKRLRVFAKWGKAPHPYLFLKLKLENEVTQHGQQQTSYSQT